MKKKLTTMLLLTAFLSLWQSQITIAANGCEYSSLPARTQVIIKNNEELNTNNIMNTNTVVFSVVQDVKDKEGNVFIKSGTPVSADIQFKKQKNIGKSGEITIKDLHTKTVDGSDVTLTASISEKPDNKIVSSVLLSVFICPLFLLLKGNNAVIPKDTIYNVYTLSDVYVKTTDI